jgi:hypothetical protein
VSHWKATWLTRGSKSATPFESTNFWIVTGVHCIFDRFTHLSRGRAGLCRAASAKPRPASRNLMLTDGVQVRAIKCHQHARYEDHFVEASVYERLRLGSCPTPVGCPKSRFRVKGFDPSHGARLQSSHLPLQSLQFPGIKRTGYCTIKFNSSRGVRRDPKSQFVNSSRGLELRDSPKNLSTPGNIPGLVVSAH